MDVGMMMVFASYGWENCSDDRVWNEEIRLARLAADAGFDCLWSAEHHFNDYSFVPDNIQLMTYLTARHPHMDVGTAAVILPWHDPLRVAENAAVLDMLSGGKLRLGLGRGLARREFHAFRKNMDESRGRFDEAAPMIVNALKTGFMEGDGPHYKQPRVEIRPRPQHSFDGRIYAVASSEDSIDSAAKLGAHMVMFADRPWEMRAPNIERGRALHRQYHGTEPPTADADRVLRLRPQHRDAGGGGAPLPGQVRREQLPPLRVPRRALQDGEGLRLLPAEGRPGPQRGRARRRRRRLHAGRLVGHAGQDPARPRGAPEALGDFEMNVAFRFGGTPYDVCERGLKLFAKEVLPVIKKWGPVKAPAQAA
jgi:alkanesulfonate monooxygenase SsuD/methylene tetrahydromethanopterin reductase-like flavin-dependent oxidoreductase (luciferase family)